MVGRSGFCWDRSAEVDDGFWGVAEEVEEVGFADVGRGEDVVLF